MMQDDVSNHAEVEYVDSEDDDDPDESRPIMVLLRRLIRNKQNTVMTNAQIINILQKEFEMDVSSIHELEVEIYIKIIKKYLKDWPQWEELERMSTKLSNINDYDAVSKVLENKYKNLRAYLGVMLESARRLTKDAMKDVKTSDKVVNKGDVVMEIQCSRDQLVQLFFRTPHLDLNNTVFNIAKYTPTRISLASLNFQQILNFWWLKVKIQLPNIHFTREIEFNFKHTLVNKARKENTVHNELLDTSLMLKSRPKTIQSTKAKLKLLVKCFDDISINNETLKLIINECINNFVDIPDSFTIPAHFKRNFNKFMYVRYMYVDNEQHSDYTYDLQLQEMICPVLHVNFGRFDNAKTSLPTEGTWFTIECVLCKVKFDGSFDGNVQNLVVQHYNDCHNNESDWQCTNCRKVFDIQQLAENRWKHECWQ